MKEDERLTGALQENILTLLCFDDAHCKIARAALTPHLFSSAPFKEIAGHAIDFIDQYGEAIKDHLPDQLEHILNGDDQRKAATYKRLLENLYTSREGINGEYVLKQLQKFVRVQKFKSGLVAAVELMEETGDIDGAEVLMQQAMASQIVSFDPGLNLGDPENIDELLDKIEEEGFTLGIDALDIEGIIPRRKELMMLMASRGKGKSWFLVHVTKRALMQRWKVVVITLEMPESQYMGRLLQALFSISKRHAEVEVTRMRVDEGAIEDLFREKITRPTFRDDDIKAWLKTRARKEFKRRPPLYVKEFPTSSLSLKGLEAYLDGLERFHGFVPDAIVLDYPDLMEFDAKNARIELGRLVAGFRGICSKRNAAGIVVTQGNRESEDAALVKGAMAAEDISKLAHADVFLTLSQTPAEYSMGLARLYVEKARQEAAKFQILITQAIAIGQFVLDSVRLKGKSYWGIMADKESETKREREDDEASPPPPRRRRREDEDDQPSRRRRVRNED